MKRALITLVFLVVFGAGAASAQPGRDKWDENGRPGFFRGLNISEEQRRELRSMKEERFKMKEQMEGLRNERQALGRLLRDSSVSEDEIRGKAKELSARQARLGEQRIENLLRLRRTLKPEQFNSILDKIQEKMRERFGGRSEEGQGGFRRGGMGFGGWGAE